LFCWGIIIVLCYFSEVVVSLQNADLA
jgi:hypothetical protein